MNCIITATAIISALLLITSCEKAKPLARTGQSSVKAPSPKQMDPFLALDLKAATAAKKGDFEGAERIYRQIEAQWPEEPFLYRHLGVLYDKLGRDHDAMIAWGKEVHGVGRSGSSDQRKPIVLTHYGDLCLKFGKRAEADAAYLRANQEQPSHTGRRYDISVNEEMPSKELRAYAHAEAGMEHLSHGEAYPAISDFEIAVALCPDLPIIRVDYAFGLQQTGMNNESRYQFWKAQQLAEGDLAATIEQTRRNYGYLYQDLQVHMHGDGKGRYSEDVQRVLYNPKTAKPLRHRPLKRAPTDSLDLR